MEKCSEKRKKEKKNNNLYIKKAVLILLCTVFFICGIYLVDMRTRTMLLRNDDQYALALNKLNDDIIRLDIAGEKYELNIKTIKGKVDLVIKAIKELSQKFIEYMKSNI